MEGNYVVAVIGGACAGSEITARLVGQGMEVVVFEQNDLPYGKIEDGLPRWHAKLQDKEKARIDEKLDQKAVHFVPRCALGKDISVSSLVNDWQFPMVIMANGAWRDRSLRVDGADQIKDESLLYQNAFVYWFNHYHEKNYSGPSYHIPGGATVIGGGLASIDVAKILQFQMVKQALEERGQDVDIIELEHQGIHKVLEEHGLSWEGLGLQPARLIYRKRIEDMPLVPLGDAPDADKLKKAEAVRVKLVRNATQKYGFEVFPLHTPTEIHSNDGSLSAVTFKQMEFKDGRFVDSGQTMRVETQMLISSIGSLPEPIDEIPMDGELYQWEDHFTGQVSGLEQFYCVGNAITGRGNIKDSAKNARRLADVIEAGIQGNEPDYAALFRAQEEEARSHVKKLLAFLKKTPATSEAQKQIIRGKVAEHHRTLDYQSYAGWRDQLLAKR